MQYKISRCKIGTNDNFLLLLQELHSNYPQKSSSKQMSLDEATAVPPPKAYMGRKRLSLPAGNLLIPPPKTVDYISRCILILPNSKIENSCGGQS